MGSVAVYSVDAYHAGNVRLYYDCASAFSDSLSLAHPFSGKIEFLTDFHRNDIVSAEPQL